MEQNRMDYEVSLSKKSDFPSYLRIWSHDCFSNTSSSYFLVLCNSLPWLRASSHAENTWNNQMCTCSLFLFLSFFLSFSHKCTGMHNHTPILTHSNNTSTTFKPCDLARHYANGQTCHLPEITETEWESMVRAHTHTHRNCAHLSVCERSLWRVSTVHTQGTWDLAASYLLQTVVWGESILRKKQTRDL